MRALPLLLAMLLAGCQAPPPSPIHTGPSQSVLDFNAKAKAAWAAQDAAAEVWMHCLVPAATRLARASRERADVAATAAMQECSKEERAVSLAVSGIGEDTEVHRLELHQKALEIATARIVKVRAQ